MTGAGRFLAGFGAQSRRLIAGVIALLCLVTFALGLWSETQLWSQRTIAQVSAAQLACAQTVALVQQDAATTNFSLLEDVLRTKSAFRYFASLLVLNSTQGASVAPGRRRELGRGVCTLERQAARAKGAKLTLYEGEDAGRRYAIARAEGSTDQGEASYVLETAFPYDSSAAGWGRIGLGLAILAVIVTGLVGAAWLITYMDRRLRVLTATLRRAADGEYSARVGGHDDVTELGVLSREIDGALSRIEDQVITLNLAEARAGHELLDPLSRALSRLEVLSNLRLSRAAAAELAIVASRLRAAAATATSLLQMARNERSPKVEVSLGALLDAVVAEETGEAGGLRIDLAADPGLCTMAHAESLRILVANLLRNCRKYAADGSAQVTLRRAQRDGQAMFRLEIVNAVVPAAKAPDDLTALFARGADSAQPGFGIGLDTARVLAMRDGFQFGQTASPGLFRVWLTGAALSQDRA